MEDFDAHPAAEEIMSRVVTVSAYIVYALLIFIPTVGQVRAATIELRADGTGEYPTIQAAIDAAAAGDEIVLARGVYTGPGNRNLNFEAKAVTLRSRNPENDNCMMETIIDAQGQGVIARFVNDEGPGTVFEGFTLGAGDTTEDLRGDPGFFEFSRNARPTTRRLRNKPSANQQAGKAIVAASTGPDPNFPGWIPPFGGRVWDGHDPFHQPVATSDYYGSGDVDNDGNLTPADVSVAQAIVDGNLPAVTRADVDGDGDVDGNDVSLIDDALGGAVLGAWWDNLATSAQRNTWVDRFLAIDKTDEHEYYADYFICNHFALQTYIDGAFLRGDFATQGVEYNGGQTIFNLPLYFVSVGSPSSHAINAVLVGDDPLNFEDWRFIEPQDDSDVRPGGWNMRYESTIWLKPQWLHGDSEAMVAFYIDETGPTLVEASPELVTTRVAAPAAANDNRVDRWNCRLITTGQGAILFERMREDMTRTTDVHLASLCFPNIAAGVPLTMDQSFARLLDVYEVSESRAHLLWEGKTGTQRQNLFHGILDPLSAVVTDITQVASDLRLPNMGRVLVTPDGKIHIFWFEGATVFGPSDFGVHWTSWNGSGWEAPQKLTVGSESNYEYPDWMNRQFGRYFFDVEVLDNGNILLVWVDKVFPSFYISQLLYDGAWHGSQIADTGWYNSVRGLDLCKDSAGVVHLVYWRGDRQEAGGTEEGRGNLYHRSFDGVSWSGPVVIDDTNQAACPRMAASATGQIYLTWESKIAGRVLPFRSVYENGIWQSPEQMEVRPDANAWYPTVNVLADGTPVFAWSSRSRDLVTIGMWPSEIEPPEPLVGDFDSDNDVDFLDLSFFISHWLAMGCDDSAGDESDWCFGTDLDKSGKVDFREFAKLASNWSTTVPRVFLEDFETGDFSKYDWRNSGQDWSIVSDIVYEGDYAARANAVDEGDESELRITLDVEFTQVSFYFRLNCEDGVDSLTFYVDFTERGTWTGQHEWNLQTYTIAPGRHSLKWIYEKDSYSYDESEGAWLDKIRIGPP